MKQLGIIGLGKMGSGVAARVRAAGFQVVGYDSNREALHRQEHITQAQSLEEFVRELAAPRVIWLALPAGNPTDGTLLYLETLLLAGDTICNAGNVHFHFSEVWATKLKERGIHYCDVGISGGLKGRTEGYALMVGGEPDHIPALEPLFHAIAQPGGYAHVGRPGAGHYVKMVHNGIEYVMMQGFAEGMHLLAKGSYKGQLDLAQIADVWQHGSIIESYLGSLIAKILDENTDLDAFSKEVHESGEGVWSVQEATALKVPVPTMSLAVSLRHASQDEAFWQQRILSALRGAFGGHPQDAPQ